ncbi:putative codeine 3-O-demethylase [Helianthus annuus]|nr:putative codeine 3-O-demethylase [Helianthus annuus]
MENNKINFGRSLIVPSVQELAKGPSTQIPPRYVHHDHHPTSDDDARVPSVPVVDLHCLLSGSCSELHKLHTASKEWGFFQVINHGISESILEDFKTEVLNMFNLPMEEKLKLWQEEDNHEGFGQLFVVSEDQKLDWSDMFYLTTLPHDLRQSQLFQKLPLTLSIEHRATVNSNNERMSVATFYSSSMGTELGPARSLVAQHNVANFRRVPIETYFKEFFARKLDGKSYLDFMKLD